MKITFLVLVLSLTRFAWSANQDAGQPFTLSVVPSRSSAQGGTITIADDKPDEFYVVLSNTSKDAQRVFESWNSWGYQTVSFEFVTPDGKKTVVSKRPQDFTRNFPSTFLIPPGEHQVYAIRLDKWWEARPILTARAETQITLKAIYQVSATPESTKEKVWTGRVESKAYNLVLKYRRTPK